MLHQMTLENFKAFEEEQQFSLRPITLIYGANSSGKSSILNALLLLKQTVEESVNCKTSMLFKGSYTDQQNYSRCVNGRDVVKNFSIGLGHGQLSWGYEEVSAKELAGMFGISEDELDFKNDKKVERHININEGFLGNKKNAHLFLGENDFFLRKNKYCQINGNTILKEIDFFLNGDLFCTLEWAGDTYGIGENSSFLFSQYIDHHFEEPLVDKYKDKIPDEYLSDDYYGEGEYIYNTIHYNVTKAVDSGALGRDIFDCYPYRIIESSLSEKVLQLLYSSCLTDIKKPLDYTFNKFKEEVLFETRRSLIFVKNGIPIHYEKLPEEFFDSGIKPFLFDYEESKYSHVYNFFPINIIGHRGEFLNLLDNITYIGPMRKFPERFTDIIKDSYSSVGVDGGQAVAILYDNPDLLSKINGVLRNLGMDYELKIKSLENDGYQAFGDIYSLQIIDIKTNVPLTLCDVGFGVSQVLPIIVQALMPKHNAILIEQPEIHLHPKMQTELGDFFIQQSKKKQFIIETHSEHLLLRILRRIRETAEEELQDGELSITPDDVSVLYVQTGKNGAEVVELPINENGEFVRPWPSGFFTERAAELF